MRIRKHQSSFENSSCLAKTKNLFSYLWWCIVRNRHQKNTMLASVFHVFSSKWHNWSNHRNLTRINCWSWESRYPTFASCNAYINCFPFHYLQDSKYFFFFALFNSMNKVMTFMWWLLLVDLLVRSLFDQLQRNVDLLFQVVCFLCMHLLVLVRERGK